MIGYGFEILDMFDVKRSALSCCSSSRIRARAAVVRVCDGKMERHSSKMFGKKAASALDNQSVASKPGWPARVAGKSTCAKRLKVKAIAQG